MNMEGRNCGICLNGADENQENISGNVRCLGRDWTSQPIDRDIDNTVKNNAQQISMPKVGFETWISISTRPKTVLRAGIAQSVQRLSTGWTNKGSQFESRWGQEFSLLHVVETGSGTHPASHPMGIGGNIPGGKAAGAWSWPLTSN
jgi:hypothetical protein